MSLEWCNNIATVNLQRRNRALKKPLPLPEDIKKLADYLMKQLTHFDLTDRSNENYL